MKRLNLKSLICLLAALFTLSAAQAEDSEKSEPKAAEKAVKEEKTTTEEEQAIVKVLMKTSMGDITLELDREKAPLSVKNFLSYVDSNFYDGTIFHRVIPNFMIQCGGFTEDMTKKPTQAAIPNEGGNGLQNKRYTVAMARTQNPDSATSQFYINTKNNHFLNRNGSNPGYAVFGKVIEGKDVVDEIEQVKTATKGYYQNVPVETVVIKSVSVIE